MDAEIVDVLRETMWRRSEDEERRFLAAVDSITAPVSREVVQALFDTFLPIDDFGTQESLVGTLSIVPSNLYFAVLAREIVGLMNRAPDWADDILLRAAIFDQPILIEALLGCDERVRIGVLSFMQERLFDEPEAKHVCAAVKAKVR